MIILLECSEIKVINQVLAKGYDVEIQHRKNGLVILKSEKEVCCKKDNKPIHQSTKKAIEETT
ncbi:MAG: hypothetical protein ACI4SF_08900 [Oscillospiraceae bacterium]